MGFSAELPGPPLLARRAAEHGDRVAVEIVGSDVRLTVADVHDSVLRWAGAFRRLDVDAGARVIVMLPTGIDAYRAWFGLAWLRALEVPVNVDYRGDILTYLIRHSKARVAVVSSRYLDRLGEIAAEIPQLETVVVPDPDGELPALPFKILTGEEFLADAEPATGLTPPGWDDVAAVIYTSGTTGPSKGVLVPWGELATLGSVFPDETFTSSSRLYSFWPTFHMSGKWPFYAVIDRGATLCLRDRWKTDAFWDDVRRHDANLAVIFGPLPLFLAAQPPAGDDADNPLTDVIMAPVPPDYRAFEERFGVRVHTASGMTEIGLPMRAYHPLPNHRTGGRLADGYEVRVVDEGGQDVGPDVAGELLVRAENPARLSRGYLDMPEATEQAWSEGWFHTGDAFRYDDDGNWYFVDRLKDCLRRRGENISSFEVENAVNAHPDVLESAAVAAESEWGEQEVKILVVRKPDGVVTEHELVQFLMPRMPRFMVPRYVEFVDEFPKTPTGKVKKVELRDRGITPATWDRDAAGVVVPK
jgi:crotonobetaine/carnitine-CoA ligase